MDENYRILVPRVSEDYKGFRFGVREVVGTESQPLLDVIETQLAAESARPSLSALELIELGSVYLNEQRCLNSGRHISFGDKIRIHTAPRRYLKPESLRSRIQQEDSTYLVIDKPAGLPASPEVDNFQENLISYLEEELGQTLFLVTALDPESSGPVVIAKSSSAFETLKEAFKGNQIQRLVAAFVSTRVELGVHDSGIEILSCEERNAETTTIAEGSSTWTVIGSPLQSYYRLEIRLLGARPLDMRRALADLCAPIIGDQTNGSLFETRLTETNKSTPAFKVISFQF